jgi:hypothetical protein
MHEFEQGVWKNLFTHLIRMIHASDPALVHEMDQRYDKTTFSNLIAKSLRQISWGAEIWKGWCSQIFCKLI